MRRLRNCGLLTAGQAKATQLRDHRPVPSVMSEHLGITSASTAK